MTGVQTCALPISDSMMTINRLNFGLKDDELVAEISQPGIDVLEATPEELLFSTRLDGLILLESGSLYVPDTGTATISLNVGGRALVTYQQNIQFIILILVVEHL